MKEEHSLFKLKCFTSAKRVFGQERIRNAILLDIAGENHMVQSSSRCNKNADFLIDSFREKHSRNPPLQWETLEVHFKLWMEIVLPTKWEHEESIEGSSVQSKRERKSSNAQLKTNWQNER